MPTTVHPRSGEALAPGLIARWAAIPVTIACDVAGAPVLIDPAIRRIGPPAGHPATPLAAAAVTAWCDRGDFGAALHAIEAARAGEVLAIACDGRTDTAVIGELLAGAMRRKGILGAVVDGAVRDVATLAGLADLAVWARATTARGPLAKERGAVNAPVSLGGVTVLTGDLILADADGIVALAPARAAALIAAAEARLAAEAGWEAALVEGRSVLEVFAVPEAI